MSRELEQEDIENTPPFIEVPTVILQENPLSVEAQEVLKENPLSVEAQEVLKETPFSVGEQEVLKETSSVEQEVLKETSSSVEQEVFKETPSSVEEQMVSKETTSSVEEQEVLKETPSSVEEQEVLKETPSSVEEQEVLKETPSSVEEQEVLKETSSSNEDQEVLKEAPTSVDEQKVLKETPSSDRDQENLKETPSSDGEQILKDTQTIEGKQEVLLTESEIKVEPEDTQESEYGELNGSIIILSDDEDELPVPLSIPLSASSHAKELINCLNESRYCIPKRCSSTLAYYDGYLPVNLPDRRSVSVPREINLACEKKPKPILPVSAYIDLLSDSSDENDSDCSSENKLRPNLKRKRSLNNLLHNFEIENTRKTMKPGPKSKTRNIATVHEMITEAKLLGLGPSMESDTSDDDSDMSDEESELYIMDTIDLMSATDDEPDDGDLKPEADDDGKKDCLSDDVKENSINGENKMIDNKLSATLDDETNGNEVLEKAIDSNIIKEDENMENKELKSMEVHPNQMTEDKSCSDEIEKKNNLNDTNELLKVGE